MLDPLTLVLEPSRPPKRVVYYVLKATIAIQSRHSDLLGRRVRYAEAGGADTDACSSGVDVHTTMMLEAPTWMKDQSKRWWRVLIVSHFWLVSVLSCAGALDLEVQPRRDTRDEWSQLCLADRDAPEWIQRGNGRRSVPEYGTFSTFYWS